TIVTAGRGRLAECAESATIGDSRMERPKRRRPARSLFERAEITTRDVAVFLLWYAALPLGIYSYVWWTRWGHNGTDEGWVNLKIIGITWLLTFILFANGAIQQRLKKIARRDGVTPEVLVSQVEPPIQTNRERVTMLAAILISTAFGSYGLWWWKYARDGEVSRDDVTSAKVLAGAWVMVLLICVIQFRSGARNMRRQLEARRLARKKRKKRKKPGRPLGERLPDNGTDSQP
ncbi:MAG TPA: hypothetical protein VI072_21375, partial [Polyangiaceae bacterium]